MQIPTVENFLFCLELQLGGIVCGWMGVIGSVLGVIGTLLAMIFGRQFIGDFFFSPIKTGHIAGNGGNSSAVTIIIGGIIAIIFLAVYFYCSWKLLKGTENVSLIFVIANCFQLIN